MDVERLGKVIALARTARGLSLTQLAKRSGLSSAYLSLLERGLRRPSPEALAAISKAVDMNQRMLKGLSSGSRVPQTLNSEVGTWIVRSLS